MTPDELRSGFAEPSIATAPMLRWWWFGPTVERAEIDRELTAMAAAGFGGVEVAFVYPYEATDSPFGSDRFLAELRFAADRARALGLRFDLTLGSGWSFGGPHIGPDLAARRLQWERREIQPGALSVPVTQPWPGDELVAVFVGAGSLQEPPEDVEPVPVVDGRIEVPAGVGTRVVLLAWSQRTGQSVKRAALGAEGPVLDHYAAPAVDAHLREVGDRLLDAVPAELLGSVFCDSLEAYEADWTPELPAEFARRRGYQLLPVLSRLVVEGPDAARVRADVHRTLVELYEQNFVARIRSWAAGRGVPFRLQGYGTPPATLSSYRFADLVEGEGVGWRELTPSRWAASAGHLYGRNPISAEVWTWVHSPSFRATPLDLAAEAHDHLLNGVNLLIGHGWPYSPSGGPGLGWIFYAAGALDDRNPWWPAAPALTGYLRRLCWLQQQGEPVADVAVYVSNDDLFAGMGRAVGGSLDTWREARRRIPPELTGAIRTAGFDYDLVDDEAIAVVGLDRYPVLVVPPTTLLPAETERRLGERQAAGRSVIRIESDPVGSADELVRALTARRRPDLSFVPPAADLGYVHRRHDGGDSYLVVNTGPTRHEVEVVLRDRRHRVEEWDPRTGRVRRVVEPEAAVTIVLAPYQATVLVTADRTSASADSDPAPAATGNDPAPMVWTILADGWEVEFPGEAPAPVTPPHVWEAQPGRAAYSGTARYRRAVELAGDPGSRVVLDLGPGRERPADARSDPMVGTSFRAEFAPPVGEVAVVTVNGIDCGVAWAPPYEVDVSTAVRPGRNLVEITVANTAANALSVDADLVAAAARSEQRFGRRARLQDLTRATATVRSGLLQPPSIGVSAQPPRTPTRTSAP